MYSGTIILEIENMRNLPDVYFPNLEPIDSGLWSDLQAKLSFKILVNAGNPIFIHKN